MDLISYAKNNREGEVSNIIIKGSFSTKIESVTLKLLELITQDPNVKVLIFSNVSLIITSLYSIPEVFKLCVAAPRGVVRVCEGSRVKAPKTNIIPRWLGLV